MNKPQTVVCIVAHPDDVGHTMGGTALLMKDRYPIHVICLTKGERGIPGTSYEDAARIREAEERAACEIIGAEVTFMGEINGKLYANHDLCKRVSDLVCELSPLAIFTLWPINTHPDHSACYEIAMQALHMGGLYDDMDVYMMENDIGGQTSQFEPDLYVDISDVIETKEKIVRCHRSQNPTEERIQFIMHRSRVRGMFAHCPYAEAFKLLRPLINRRGGKKKDYFLLSL